MLEYRVRGRSAASDATADHGVGVLWNPSTTRSLFIVEIHLSNTTAATAQIELARISVRGTPGSTVTPDIDDHIDHAIAPPTGALLDLSNYSVEPTVLAPSLDGYYTAPTIGAGKIWNFRAAPIKVLTAAGFGIINADAVAVPACEIVFVWQE